MDSKGPELRTWMKLIMTDPMVAWSKRMSRELEDWSLNPDPIKSYTALQKITTATTSSQVALLLRLWENTTNLLHAATRV